MKNVKLYNVCWLPIWMLMFFPQCMLISLPVNFIIDSVVLLIAFAVLRVKKCKDKYWKSIKRVWCFGFIADFVGAIVMFIATFIIYHGKDTDIGLALIYEPIQNKVALFWTILSIIIASVCIYKFDSKYAFSETDLTEKQKKKISLIMAIFTAPYVMLIPSAFFYYVMFYYFYW